MGSEDALTHLGRSRNRGSEIVLSGIGGFLGSFMIFILGAYQSRVYQGQLLAGDPNLNRQYPTTLNAMKSTLAGENPIASALTSYAWWTCVVVGGIVLSFVVFKLVRRYV